MATFVCICIRIFMVLSVSALYTNEIKLHVFFCNFSPSMFVQFIRIKAAAFRHKQFTCFHHWVIFHGMHVPQPVYPFFGQQCWRRFQGFFVFKSSACGNLEHVPKSFSALYLGAGLPGQRCMCVWQCKRTWKLFSKRLVSVVTLPTICQFPVVAHPNQECWIWFLGSLSALSLPPSVNLHTSPPLWWTPSRTEWDQL